MKLEHGIAYNCQTKQDYDAFVALIKSMEYGWTLGDAPWKLFNSLTCLDVEFCDGEIIQVSYCSCRWYEDNGWTVVPFARPYKDGLDVV